MTNQFTTWFVLITVEEYVTVNVCICPAGTVAMVGAIVISGWGTRSTVVEAEALVSDTETAETICEVATFTVAGAVNTPLVLMVPVVGAPPTVPSTSQVTPVLVILVTTPVLVTVLFTVAVNVTVWFGVSV